MPNIFESANIFDLGPQDSLIPDMPDLTSLSKTPSLSSAEKAIDPRPEGDLQADPLAKGFGQILPVSTLNNGSSCRGDQHTAQIDTFATSPRVQADILTFGLSPQDHDSLLEMCMLFWSGSAFQPYRRLMSRQMIINSACFL